MATSAPAQPKQPSRKGKRAWRKNIDINDVEQQLEELREEEKLGGRLHAKPNEDLFVIDTKGDENVAKKVRSKRPLKMDEILSARSAIPAVGTRSSKLSNGLVTRPKKIKGVLSRYEKERLAKMVGRGSELGPQPSGELTAAVKQAGSFDVWDAPTEQDLKDNIPEPVRKKPKKMPSSMAVKPATSDRPHVSIPHAGASYNPTVTDHQELLRQAHQEEEKRQAVRDHLRGLQVSLKRRREAEADAEWEARQSILADTQEVQNRKDGLLEEEPSGSSEDSDTANEDEKKPEANRRKTKAERKKEMRRAEARREEEARKKAKSERIEGARIKQLAKEVEKAESTKKVAKKDAADKRPRKLGKHDIKQPATDVQLNDELSESFRAFKPEGNLFRDRYVSLTERQLVETRVPVAKRQKFPTKFYEKHSYKRFK